MTDPQMTTIKYAKSKIGLITSITFSSGINGTKYDPILITDDINKTLPATFRKMVADSVFLNEFRLFQI